MFLNHFARSIFKDNDKDPKNDSLGISHGSSSQSQPEDKMNEPSGISNGSLSHSKPEDKMNETGSIVELETIKGSHQLCINGYSLTKGIGVGQCFVSDVFNVGGYDWKITYYPDGLDVNQESPHISVCLQLHSPVETDVRAKFCLFLSDHNDKIPQKKSESWPPKTFNREKSQWGYKNFMKRADLEQSKYLKDDCIRIICQVEVVEFSTYKLLYNYNNSNYKTNELGFHASNLASQFGELLESKEGADVIFEVQGEKFMAHRFILATRSPVFKAELLGSMSERSAQCIKIEDMTPLTFRELLHFIYTDSLSPSVELADVDFTLMIQHLLVAADRYALEMLKLFCEDKLCKTIFVETVATTLVLAEQHNCGRLKLACLEFLTMPQNLLTVMLSNGFEDLKMNCPVVLKEVREKLQESTALRGVLERLSFASIS